MFWKYCLVEHIRVSHVPTGQLQEAQSQGAGMVGGGTGLAVARAGLDDQGGSAAAKALLARLDPLASFRITMAMLW